MVFFEAATRAFRARAAHHQHRGRALRCVSIVKLYAPAIDSGSEQVSSLAACRARVFFVAKIQGRKPAKRKPAKPEPDDDLIELALALDEHRLSRGPEDWFKIPWHDGWNAIQLAYNMWHPRRHYTHSGQTLEASFQRSEELNRWMADRARANTESYWGADSMIVENADDRLLVAILRCYQIFIAGSHGGGHVYNDILRPVLTGGATRELIVRYRCWDAIGVGLSLENDINDRLRRAFKIAWERGLYHAAYALPRAVEL